MFDAMIRQTIQGASLVIALMALVRVTLTARRIKRAWLSVLPLWVFLLHVIVFYCVLLNCGAENAACQLPTGFFGDWSSIVRLHAVTTILFLPLGHLVGPYRHVNR